MYKFSLSIEDSDRSYSVPNIRSEADLLSAIESVLERKVSPGFIEGLSNGSVPLVVIREDDFRISVERVRA